MATSGSISTVYVPSVDAILSWQRTSYSITDNTSTIEWTLSLVSRENAIFWNSEKGYLITIHGKRYEGSADPDLGFNETKVLASGTQVLRHTANGRLTFSYGFTYGISSLLNDTEISATGVGTLDPIPRPATVTNAQNFSDEDNPTITYSSPSGAEGIDALEACISFTGAKDDIPYRAISKTDTTYTFELTDAERAILRKGITKGNATTVRFYVRTKIGNETRHSYLTKTLTLVNYEPTLAPRVVATDTRTKELTGDSAGGAVIRYYSNVSFNTRAAARKEATIEYQTIINGSTKLDDYTSNTGTITGVDSNTFYFSVTDSRGHVTSDAVVFSEDNGKFIPYVGLTNHIKTTSLTANGELSVTVSGKYFDGSFGAKSNSLELEYLVLDENDDPVFNKNGSGWVQLGTVSPTVSDNDYTYTFTITGLDYRGTYKLTVNAIDELTPVQTSTKVISATPVFDWGKDDFRHHTNVYMEGNLSLTTNNSTIRGRTTDNRDVQILGINSANNTVLGWGGYDTGLGSAAIYGKHVYLNTKENVYINGNKLADYIIEQGTSGDWFYRKWNSGKVELWGTKSLSNVSCGVEMGALYRTAVQTSPRFPFTVYNPRVIANYETQGYGAFIWPTTNSTNNYPFDFYLVRPTEIDNITGTMVYYVIGEWK